MAAKQAVVAHQMKNPNASINGRCATKNGNLLCYSEIIDVQIEGTKPKDGGMLTFQNGNLIEHDIEMNDNEKSENKDSIYLKFTLSEYLTKLQENDNDLTMNDLIDIGWKNQSQQLDSSEYILADTEELEENVGYLDVECENCKSMRNGYGYLKYFGESLENEIELKNLYIFMYSIEKEEDNDVYYIAGPEGLNKNGEEFGESDVEYYSDVVFKVRLKKARDRKKEQEEMMNQAKGTYEDLTGIFKQILNSNGKYEYWLTLGGQSVDLANTSNTIDGDNITLSTTYQVNKETLDYYFIKLKSIEHNETKNTSEYHEENKYLFKIDGDKSKLVLTEGGIAGSPSFKDKTLANEVNPTELVSDSIYRVFSTSNIKIYFTRDDEEDGGGVKLISCKKTSIGSSCMGGDGAGNYSCIRLSSSVKESNNRYYCGGIGIFKTEYNNGVIDKIIPEDTSTIYFQNGGNYFSKYN